MKLSIRKYHNRNSIFNLIQEKKISQAHPLSLKKSKAVSTEISPSLCPSPKTRGKKEKMSARIHIHASFSARWSVHGPLSSGHKS